MSEKVVSLPQDLIKEILSNLPVQPLLKFRCVSKPWRSLIGNKHFIKSHLHNSKNNAAMLRTSTPSPLFDYYAIPRIVGSCNGLICVLSRRNTPSLWNPSTRAIEMLPEIDCADTLLMFGYMGFGWEESRNEYKILAHVSAFHEGITAWVYSSITNSWKKVALECGQPRATQKSTMQLVCGKFHWDHDNWGDDDDRHHIVSFDLKTDKFGRIEMPSHVQKNTGVGLAEIGGCLCIYNADERGGYGMVDVWVMKEYGSAVSWVKLMAMSQVHDLLQHPLSATSSLVLPDGKIVMLSPSIFAIYYPQQNKFWLPSLCDTSDEILRSCNIFPTTCFYVQSLVSPRMG